MDAKKCDRCGKFYCKESKNAYMIRGNGTLFDNVTRKGYDLCSECDEELNEWINSDGDDK